jgi:hypothetical protein
MRNTSMLKILVTVYDITYSMDKKENMYIILTDKKTGTQEAFSGNSNSQLLNKGFAHLKKNYLKQP